MSAGRIAAGISYVAGGVALNALTNGTRLSRDIDIFHDTETAVWSAWSSDRAVLEKNGYTVASTRERPGFVEAVVRKGGESVLVQWAQDSAFRFFPLIEHAVLGLALHPLDLATNKVLAMAGRLEVRDWIDVIHCHDTLQNAGYLFWAACGKDPGFGPAALLGEARRSSHYSAAEVDRLAFEGPPPDAAGLSRRWREILEEAGRIIDRLPADEAGACVLTAAGDLFRGGPEALAEARKRNAVRFHQGSIKGAFPRIVEQP